MSWISKTEEFGYRKEIVLTTDMINLTNHQVKLHVGDEAATGEDLHCSGHCSTDFTDVRFMCNTSATPLPYYIESIAAGDPSGYVATIWVKLPAISYPGTTITMYYGNAVLKSESSTSALEVFHGTIALTASANHTVTGTVAENEKIEFKIKNVIDADKINQVQFLSGSTPVLTYKFTDTLGAEGADIYDSTDTLVGTVTWTNDSDDYSIQTIYRIGTDAQVAGTALDAEGEPIDALYLPSISGVLTVKFLTDSGTTTMNVAFVTSTKYTVHEPAVSSIGAEEARG